MTQIKAAAWEAYVNVAILARAKKVGLWSNEAPRLP
jgi:hypothetical protein